VAAAVVSKFIIGRKVRDGGAADALENLITVCRGHHAGAEMLS